MNCCGRSPSSGSVLLVGAASRTVWDASKRVAARIKFGFVLFAACNSGITWAISGHRHGRNMTRYHISITQITHRPVPISWPTVCVRPAVVQGTQRSAAANKMIGTPKT